MKFTLRDPFSGLTHLLGAGLGIVALVFLVIQSVEKGTVWDVVSFSIFGASIILLYSSSALYHLSRFSESTQLILRRVDHTMIFLLIAGTYTPFCLGPLRGTKGFIFFGFVWLVTVIGILFKIFWIHAPRWLSTALYLGMGWLAVVVLPPLSRIVSPESLHWLIAGGLFYTVGAVIYALKWPDPFPEVFGFHEIWHLFVLAGSTSHVISVYSIFK